MFVSRTPACLLYGPHFSWFGQFQRDICNIIQCYCRSIEGQLEELTAYALELHKNDYSVTGKLYSNKNMPCEIRILFDDFIIMSLRVYRKIKKAEAESLNDALTGLHNLSVFADYL